MEDNKNLVTDVTENVEQTTEETQPEKTYTQSEVNEIVGKAKARTRAKIQKENDRKYGELLETLAAGTGESDIGKINDKFRDFYQQNGVELPQKPNYTTQDIKVLAKSDADEIIRNGFDEVIEEADRLKELGVENMTAREKELFVALTNHIKATETSQELAKIGVTEDVYNSKEFAEFASMFNPKTPIDKVFSLYRQEKQPNKNYQTMGSMKNHESGDNGVKDFYSVEEARKFTKEDFDKNPALYEAVQKSAQRWR